MSRPKTLGTLQGDVDALIAKRRKALAQEATRIYSETKSLRKTAQQLGVSYETVRVLLVEAKLESTG